MSEVWAVKENSIPLQQRLCVRACVCVFLFFLPRVTKNYYNSSASSSPFLFSSQRVLRSARRQYTSAAVFPLIWSEYISIYHPERQQRNENRNKKKGRRSFLELFLHSLSIVSSYTSIASSLFPFTFTNDNDDYDADSSRRFLSLSLSPSFYWLSWSLLKICVDGKVFCLVEISIVRYCRYWLELSFSSRLSNLFDWQDERSTTTTTTTTTKQRKKQNISKLPLSIEQVLGLIFVLHHTPVSSLSFYSSFVLSLSHSAFLYSFLRLTLSISSKLRHSILTMLFFPLPINRHRCLLLH